MSLPYVDRVKFFVRFCFPQFFVNLVNWLTVGSGNFWTVMLAMTLKSTKKRTSATSSPVIAEHG